VSPLASAENRAVRLLAAGSLQGALSEVARLFTARDGTKVDATFGPSGDYAWKLFEKAETVQPGAYKALDAKAINLTGASASPSPPAGRSIYSVMLAEHKATFFSPIART
jgi:accessory colonization factor AcfC